MSNLPQEAGKVATSLIDSLKSQPLLILVLALNVIFIGVSYFAADANRNRQASMLETVLGACLPGHVKE